MPIGGTSTAQGAPGVAGSGRTSTADVGDWDNSVCINAPGQSGDPGSPHYGDLALLWARGEYAPLLYSRARVEEATVARVRLVPPAS